jgi:hypothetical protein
VCRTRNEIRQQQQTASVGALYPASDTALSGNHQSVDATNLHPEFVVQDECNMSHEPLAGDTFERIDRPFSQCASAGIDVLRTYSARKLDIIEDSISDSGK